jgi:hypothetical protein
VELDIVLVYLKEPMAASSIDGKRIYGENFAYGRFGPTDIPKKLYAKNKDILKEAPYTSRWLEEKFGTKFPDINFTPSRLRDISFKKTVELAKCLGINYIGNVDKANPQERRALRIAIINKLTD